MIMDWSFIADQTASINFVVIEHKREFRTRLEIITRNDFSADLGKDFTYHDAVVMKSAQKYTHK